ncbi:MULTISPECIES: cobyrinate a,c-diamide synthase [unclassified Rhizobium]|uniref:cobyrinate a,c-diamide synthase n=1 Tax=unclassified Rhizobium TaxID=2613769 RepID=UPI0006F3F222|nr:MULTISPECIES: cobyrinate a,c-diamide synthase [unclassified Rhizobium]KQV34669.1 cobyrinic acid a,c-diamide synthase [Rhizobium sp. Root1212]KRD24003.1 cobyrinic acid a,c-diamide synthase [Rhizobium sp. Root268]
MSGILIAAPASGSGKTTVTLGLLRALRRRGVALSPGKAGPDYIDPAFHAAASGETCLNYDPWAMRPALLSAQAAEAGGKMLVIEAMMGLFDAAMDGRGSAADLAAILGLPVVLVVDCGKMAHSVAALVRGYATHRSDIRVAGVILNKVGSERHAAMLRGALETIGMPVLGALMRDPRLTMPERHLGLVQAQEYAGLDAFIEGAAALVEEGIDIDALMAIAGTAPRRQAAGVAAIAPLGQKIAIARDIAFSFAYPHLLQGWRRQGAELSFFSPLAGEGPAEHADAVYLPGGYPELHAGTLSAATGFRAGMKAARTRGARIFGECGGYMVLGEGLVAADGGRYEMLGFLPLETSFLERRRHLGYRRAEPLDSLFFQGPLMTHEFHYATILSEGTADRLFAATDAAGNGLGEMGLRREQVAGSFLHLIDRGDA